MHRRRAYSSSLDDGDVNYSTNHNFGSATHPVRALVGEANCIPWYGASVAVAFGEVVALLSHNEGILGSTFAEVRSREKISTDHFEAITPRLIGSEHQPNNFEGLLDYR